jgi:hypothetical protein
MEIQPIVFAVPSTPARTASKPSLIPWIAAAVMGVALAFALFRGPQSDGPGPGPTPINAATARVTEANSREYLLGVAAVFDDLAAKIDSRQIVNATQLQSNSRAATVAVREAAYAEVNQLDNEIINGEYAGKEAIVSAHLRSKAEGYRRAAK